MSELTPRTLKLIERIPQPELRQLLVARLESECNREALGFTNWTPEQMERVWFAVLKLIGTKSEKADRVFELARSDVRDLWVAARFANDIDAHNKWWSSRAT